MSHLLADRIVSVVQHHERNADQLVGRTRWDHIVILHGAKSLANAYRDVQITHANSLTLFGALAQTKT